MATAAVEGEAGQRIGYEPFSFELGRAEESRGVDRAHERDAAGRVGYLDAGAGVTASAAAAVAAAAAARVADIVGPSLWDRRAQSWSPAFTCLAAFCLSPALRLGSGRELLREISLR